LSTHQCGDPSSAPQLATVRHDKGRARPMLGGRRQCRAVVRACLASVLVAGALTSLSVLLAVEPPSPPNSIAVGHEVERGRTVNVDVLAELRSSMRSQACSAFHARVCAHGLVARTTAGTFDKCGREDNAIVYMRGGETVCARHRHPHDHLLAGDLLSHYLARALGVHTPCLCLRRVRPLGQWQFAKTAPRNGRLVDWSQGGDVVVLAEWRTGLQRSAARPSPLTPNAELPVSPRASASRSPMHTVDGGGRRCARASNGPT